MKLAMGRRTVIGGVTSLVLIGLGLAVVGAVGIVGWEYSNSNAFCANVCHSVHRGIGQSLGRLARAR